jgi:tetratricopeptide (TPR) repeat protein
MERYQEAETVLTRSIRSRNDAPAYAYLGRGLARYNLGLGDKACEDWSKSLRLGEGRAKAYLESHCKKETVTNQR